MNQLNMLQVNPNLAELTGPTKRLSSAERDEGPPCRSSIWHISIPEPRGSLVTPGSLDNLTQDRLRRGDGGNRDLGGWGRKEVSKHGA